MELLSELAAIGSFVSGVGVLVSLIYLAVQVRQNTKNQQIIIRHERTERLVGIGMGVATDPSLALAIWQASTGADDLTAAQWTQFNFYSRVLFQNGEDTFYQHKGGVVQEDVYRGWVDGLKFTMGSPPLRLAWRRYREQFSADYAEFVDKIVAEAPVLALMEQGTLAKWKADLAAEAAKATA